MEDMTEYQAAEWGGAELVEKLNLMELAGIGDSTDSYLTNATKLFWLASITRLSSFVSFFTHAVPNGKQLLKEHLGMDIDSSNRKTKDAAEEALGQDCFSREDERRKRHPCKRCW
ncbi:glutathione hydrolase [Desmophyllum pertusum]|uniref:Glutathione hydrolase n=1 Tax=Desmophyllum pertusum TaxID=174260 RepID=A0A9W9ZQT8_9CNID|nr:glutathione hydrolase [Desmophyllum pertusum]